MNILDESILESQRQRLQNWHIPTRHIRYDVGRRGMQDAEIIPLLLQLHQPTFFTLDSDFYKPGLYHSRYCLVYLDVSENQAADFVRRVLRHPQFNTTAKRMGLVIRAAPLGLTIWRSHAVQEESIPWPK